APPGGPRPAGRRPDATAAGGGGDGRWQPDLRTLQARPIMKKHEWRETTEEGEVRLVTATRHGGQWKLRSRLKSEAEWTLFPVIPIEDLETLHELMSNKYRRRRAPYEHVLEIEALLAAAKQRK
ncbi:MAG: hypothetical protein ACF788_11825, partial [Novipirellula sp. JB048]